MHAPSHQKSATEVNSNNSKRTKSIEQSLITILRDNICSSLVYELSNESALAITAGENKTSLTMILNDCQVSSYPHLFLLKDLITHLIGP